jgi:hypothetical protein
MCLDTAVSRSRYDYVYVSKVLRVDNCRLLSFQRTFPYFLEHMRLNDGFEMVYETDGVIIYEKH